MKPEVRRLLDQREAAGLPRHCEDENALNAVARVLKAANAGADTRRSPKNIDVPAVDNEKA
jgi:hypothetical protein